MTAPVPQKNPKKVAAGRAGAAARKKKQEHLLQELQEAKQSMLLVKESEQDKEQLTKEPDPLPPSKQPDGINQVSWIPLVLGTACPLGAFLHTHRSNRRPPIQETVIQQEPSKLKKNDPFYMA